jgi:release factor glutamine methyltransferase
MSSQKNLVIDIINKTADYLKDKGIENSRLNAELLVGFVLNLDRVQLYLNFEKPLHQSEIDKLKPLLKRRAIHEPLQYILGKTEFYSLDFKINQHTLIPRPETELLVDVTLDICNNDFSNQDRIDIFDIGTGSGNIATALTKNKSNIWMSAIDIDSEALKIAQENAVYHGVADRINFILQDIYKKFSDSPKHFDIIVSNPPYITKQEMTDLPLDVRNFEPNIALEGGEKGLDFYFRIYELASLLKENGCIVVEIGALQSEQVVDIFSNNNLFRFIEVFKDLNGKSRVVLAKK